MSDVVVPKLNCMINMVFFGMTQNRPGAFRITVYRTTFYENNLLLNRLFHINVNISVFPYNLFPVHLSLYLVFLLIFVHNVFVDLYLCGR